MNLYVSDITGNFQTDVGIITIFQGENKLPIKPIKHTGTTSEIGSITLKTEEGATDIIYVKTVEFFRGGTKLGEDVSSPYSFVWNGAAAGTHSLTAKVTDNVNNVGVSTAVSITVNANTAPTVAITSPSDNAQFHTGATITISALLFRRAI